MDTTSNVIGLLDPNDYPADQRRLVFDYNQKLLLLSEKKATLSTTISRRDQFRQAILADAVRVYNINLTKGLIESEIYEFSDGIENAVLASFGLPCPCSLEDFIDRTSKNVKEECLESFKNHFNRESLIEGYKDGERSRNLEYATLSDSGFGRIIKHTILMTIDSDTGDLIAMCCSKDITLQSSMVTVYEALNTGMWSMFFSEKRQLVNCVWSDAYRRLVGYTDREEFPDDIHSWQHIIYEEDRRRVTDAFWNAIHEVTEHSSYDIEYRMITKNQGVRWFHSVGKIGRRGDGSPALCIGLIMDIDDQKRAQESLEDQLRIVNALSRDYLNIFSIDISKKTAEVIQLKGYVTSGLSPQTRETYLYSSLFERYVEERVYEEDREMMLKAVDLDNVCEQLRTKEEYVSSYRAVAEDGIHYFQFTFTLLSGTPDKGTIIAAFKNIDSVINAAKERASLIMLSETDQMTQLLNRATGERKSSALISSGIGGMLCIIDVDKFKSVNDTFGHNVGDKVLIAIANCLRKAFRDADIVFRLGGDEFAAYVLSVKTKETGQIVLDRLFEYIEDISIPELGTRKVTLSVGAYIVEEDSNMIFEDAYVLADACVYKSKEINGNAVHFHE